MIGWAWPTLPTRSQTAFPFSIEKRDLTHNNDQSSVADRFSIENEKSGT